MVNKWFYIALIVGLFARMYDGRVISIAAGLTTGIIVSEVWKFIVWYIR